MKKNVSLLSLFLIAANPKLFFAQKIEINPDIKVTYNSRLKLGENFSKEQIFVLFGNSKDYYFGGAQNYLNDVGKHVSSGIDFQSISDYFPERIIKKDGTYHVLFTYADYRISYEERVDNRWVLYPDTKIIAGVECQMAATNKYGRRWVAYFSKEYPLNIGPYKFNGLPGLILEIFDTRKDYFFSAVKIEKDHQQTLFNVGNFKKFRKEDYLKAKYNLEYSGAAFPAMGGQMKKEYEEISANLKRMFNNPIELKPY